VGGVQGVQSSFLGSVREMCSKRSDASIRSIKLWSETHNEI